jgi:hypothetical protein
MISGNAGDDGQQHPDDGVAEVVGHLPQYRQLRAGPLKGWRQFLLQALPAGLVPGRGSRGVEEFEPPGVVITHPAHELVEDVESVDPEGEYGPAQGRPVAEDVVRLTAALRCQADALGSGHLGRARYRRRAYRLTRLGGRWRRLRLRHLRRFIAHQR